MGHGGVARALHDFSARLTEPLIDTQVPIEVFDFRVGHSEEKPCRIKRLIIKSRKKATHLLFQMVIRFGRANGRAKWKIDMKPRSSGASVLVFHVVFRIHHVKAHIGVGICHIVWSFPARSIKVFAEWIGRCVVTVKWQTIRFGKCLIGTVALDEAFPLVISITINRTHMVKHCYLFQICY